MGECQIIGVGDEGFEAKEASLIPNPLAIISPMSRDIFVLSGSFGRLLGALSVAAIFVVSVELL